MYAVRVDFDRPALGSAKQWRQFRDSMLFAIVLGAAFGAAAGGSALSPARAGALMGLVSGAIDAGLMMEIGRAHV